MPSKSVAANESESAVATARSSKISDWISAVSLVVSILVASIGGVYALKNERDKAKEKKADRASAAFDNHADRVRDYFGSIAMWKACEFQHPPRAPGQRSEDCFELERQMVQNEVSAAASLAKVEQLGPEVIDGAAVNLLNAVRGYRNQGDDARTTRNYQECLAAYLSATNEEVDRLNG
ncbi:hypothetical protein AB0F90_07420 [Micromonospora chalcea]|uniref:hypothetical protein n=1 Tax=Micromonospora chalcea TaxID=1874 RepID=UPI0033FE9CA5